MIIKVPIYLELDQKVDSSTVAEVTSFLQRKMTEEIDYLTNGVLKYKVSGKDTYFKVLTKKEVESRIIKPEDGKKPTSEPPINRTPAPLRPTGLSEDGNFFRFDGK